MNLQNINIIATSIVFLAFISLRSHHFSVKNELYVAIISFALYVIGFAIKELLPKTISLEIIKTIVLCVVLISVGLFLKDAFKYVLKNNEIFRVLFNEFLNSK